MTLLPLLAATSTLFAAAAMRSRREARMEALLRGLDAGSAPGGRSLRHLVQVIAASIPAPLIRVDDRLSRLLVLAGAGWAPREVATLRILAATATALAPLIAPGGRPGLILAGAGAVGGYRAPEFILGRRARSRQAEIERRVPDLVELLVATTEAGLAPPVAFRRASEVLPGPLGQELRVAVDEIDLGLPWRDALDGLAGRTDVGSLGRLIGAVGRSNRLGTSIRGTLRSVADDLRAERRARAEEAARRAPVKMLFPLVFLILPAFLLLTVGPVVLATIRSLRSG